MAAARRRYDPGGILTPGQGIFAPACEVTTDRAPT